ncbi:MAG: hypothetical protein FJY10_11130 [Bacteroidetes bacterium]|nr:hypothetical protein [Bacteroidota bacterium]
MKKITHSIWTWLVGIYAILGALAFFIIQTGKFFFPEAAELEMKTLPYGRFDWGFVWSDSLIAGPMLLIGGIFLLLRNLSLHRLGRLFAFTVFTINLYAMTFFWIGFAVVGEPVQGLMLWGNVVLTFLGILSMIHLVLLTMKDPPEIIHSGN